MIGSPKPSIITGNQDNLATPRLIATYDVPNINSAVILHPPSSPTMNAVDWALKISYPPNCLPHIVASQIPFLLLSLLMFTDRQHPQTWQGQAACHFSTDQSLNALKSDCRAPRFARNKATTRETEQSCDENAQRTNRCCGENLDPQKTCCREAILRVETHHVGDRIEHV